MDTSHATNFSNTNQTDAKHEISKTGANLGTSSGFRSPFVTSLAKNTINNKHDPVLERLNPRQILIQAFRQGPGWGV